jgi:hypothetical protein
MKSNRTVWLAFTLTTAIGAVLLIDPQPAEAQASRILARSQFRRTVDPSPQGPVGDLLLVEDSNGQQTLRAEIRRLDVTDLSLQVAANYYYDGTNSPVSYVAPVNRVGIQRGNWNAKLVGTNGAPPQLQVYEIGNLSDMSDLFSFDIGNPGSTNIVGGTNSIDLVCTVSNGISVCTYTTNIVGGVTNIYINSYVWAPVPPLVPKPAVFNFRAKNKFERPPLAPSPHATGTMLMTYNGTQGRSLFDFRINEMTKGQSYALWVSDGGTNWNAGNFDYLATPGGTNLRFRRDTAKGDPLPLQMPSNAYLTNRVFQVRDGFGVVHLQGVIP